MSPKHLFLPLLLSVSVMRAAQSETEYLLHTVDSGEGYWPCLFYELNYNTDIAQAERGKWYAQDEDESYWREGVGPFSIDQNKFFVTQWQSTVHPILIRRHFTLTALDIEKINVGQVYLEYSYDENPTFWLNGTKVASATGWNDDNYASLRLTGTRKKLLTEGDNVLCVSLQLGAGGGHIDYGLRVTYDPTKTGITSIEEDDDTTAYNLLGQKLDSRRQHSGIIITKGKKILQKQ